jgi:hypothetical protein
MRDKGSEVATLAKQEIERLRTHSYSELQKYLGSHVEVRTADSGRQYEVDIQAVWDDKRARTLRVLVFVNEVGRVPFIDSADEDFIMAPDGSFIGEEGN